MPDRHGIANMALGFLGAEPLQSFDDQTTQADLCKALYEGCVGVVLEDHDWRFAEAVVRLGQDATAARPDFLYSYPLPRDCIIPRGLLTSDGRACTAAYRVSRRSLCTDETSPWLVYTYRAPEQYFRPYFTKAVAYLLASELAGPLTEDAKKAADNLKAYSFWVARGRSLDSQQDTPLNVDTYDLVRWHAG
jgi:hypothetical protein